MIRNLYVLLSVGLCLSLTTCKDDAGSIGSGAAAPVVKFPMERLEVDLNRIDNLPVVAVIRSEAGLQRVTMRIRTEEETVDYKTVTDFFNPHSYSLSETPEYDRNCRAFLIEATDKLNRTVTDTLPIDVTDVVERPAVRFDPEEIVYDEMDERPVIPRTTFRVTSEAGLKTVEIYLVSASGQESKGTVNLNGEQEYVYDEMIGYTEGDRGFKVKAVDTYGYITIATLPVTYRTIPVPVVTFPVPVLEAGTDTKESVPMHIESIRGIREIVIYRVENGRETEAFREARNGDTSLDCAPEIGFTRATSRLKVVVSDGRAGKEAVGYVKTYVDLEVASVTIGSQPLANTPNEKYPDTYGLLSLNDMKTYGVDYAIAGEEQAKNVDLKFYCFGGSAVPRLYSMSFRDKDGEYSGSAGKLTAIPVRNDTRFALLSGFDFEQATAASIASEIAPSILTATMLNPIAVGDVIAFRTGNTSSAGGDRIGVMKVVGMTEPKELIPANATARVMTVEIKFPKK